MGKSFMTREKGQLISGLIGALLLMFVLWALGVSKAQAQCTQLDIVLTVDYSSSVRPNKKFLYDACISFTEELLLSTTNDVRIGVVLFGDEATVISKPDNDHWRSLPKLLPYLTEQDPAGNTNIEAGLQTATIELLEEQGNRRKMIILISDGEVTVGSPQQTLATAQQVKALGIGICAVMIKRDSNYAEFMQEISSGCFIETDYQNLIAELKKLNLCL